MQASATSRRYTRASESFRSAAEAIGTVEPGMPSIFTLTRGQWSLTDAILHCLEQTGPAHLSIWTWVVGPYDMSVFENLFRAGNILSGTLVVDRTICRTRPGCAKNWQTLFGENSVKYVVSHAKIVLIETPRIRLFMRGSMNLNFNGRFENLDISEGDEGFDMIKEIQDSLPVLDEHFTNREILDQSTIGPTPNMQNLPLFAGVAEWKP